MHRPTNATTITSHRAASPSGLLQARVIRPARLSGRAPLIVLHGISRNADELVALFRREAIRSGRIIVVPHFCAARWPHFQRPCRAARPERAPLELLCHLGETDPALRRRVDLFGHSGGAQLAHRFAMLYPQRLARLHLAAAGWYCLPDASMAYPYGLGSGGTPEGQAWQRRHEAALAAFLRLEVAVFVGTADTDRDASLRKTPALDHVQGRTRVARAETYVARFRAAALARGIAPAIDLTRLPGVAHDVVGAIRTGNLGRLVTMERAGQLACAS